MKRPEKEPSRMDGLAVAGGMAMLPPDDTEPRAALVPAPLWLIVLLGVLVYWSQLYLDAKGGGFNPQVYEPYPSLAYVKNLQPKSAEDPLFAEGRKVFEMCAACHQPTGLGSPAMNVPPLVGSEWALAEGPNRMIRIVLNGLQGPVKVIDKEWGAATMTAFKDSFSDQQIAAVLTFVRQNRDWGHNASPVKPAQVKAIRDKEASRGEAWTAEDLLKISDKD